ncbi:putative ABC transport system permease protein [Pseudomonas sp. SJZ079]|uniref:ABC transporter permease n=1 Tax=Pseudomonas sp. SJZ079 TaxID=2572887 RepID=UPI00119B4858|nr:ABC transporter permease [Pseudomonas sp. SJZ079]TWC39568.1 putative ABC transport system permease protein [Pseudomonas sp. SJZ079]
MTWLWFFGLVKERKLRLAGAAASIMLSVALLATLGAFLAQSSASMTRRAITGVPVDWQVQLVPGTTVQAMSAALANATAVARLQTVGYAEVEGFESHTGATVQTTGTGKVLGIATAYASDYPQQVRRLLGSLAGVLIAQQTAANLHAGVGDVVSIQRAGLEPADVRVAGIVDLPYADSLFQAIGVPVGAAPQAPPDNVVLLPIDQWHRLFDPQAAIRPDSVRLQLHARLMHDGLPSEPQAAFTAVQNAARNLEARIAGTGLVADNLAARLDAVRSDALYARVLFLFLGAPGVLLAAFLSLAVVASGAARRRRDQALLRIRGASRTQILQLAAVEAVCIGIVGTAAGLLLATLLSRLLLGVGIFAVSAIGWLTGAALAGIVLAPAAILATAWLDARHTTVATARMLIGQERARLWQRLGVDFMLLVLSALIFWRTWSTGYQVVLAPEGTPSSSVEYPAFLAPVLLWLGLGLLTVRLCLLGLDRGRERLAKWLNPIAGSLAGVVAAAISRQRKRMTQGIVLIALAFAFATSTAVFNTTYNAQTRVDAELTNGADVTVTGTSQAPASMKLKELSALPGVSAAQPMQHRLAYVGTDLQDLYGIDAGSIGDATRMSNAYFAGANAKQTLDLLAQTPDGILVSEETVNDFQLQVGDELNLRLQNALDHQYQVVRFHFIGVVREFPTAPRDSFLVANADYITRQTNADAAEVVLLKTSTAPAQVASAARAVVTALPGVKVTDLAQAQHLIGSSLTAVDLGGLTRLELGFAVLMVAGATGLILALGLADRRRTFAILSALGAKPRQLGAFLWSEALLLFVIGTSSGILTGFALAWMLVKLLTGVFDPPPESLSVPWLYLVILVGVALVSVVCAVLGAQWETRVPAVQRMREF